MERLFNLPKQWGDQLEVIADRAEKSNRKYDKDKWLRRTADARGAYGQPPEQVEKEFKPLQELMVSLGKEGFYKLWDTIYDLGQFGKKLGLYNLDLHSKNFMLGSDGHIVISDPFFAGSYQEPEV